jgi:hypothetical protein
MPDSSPQYDYIDYTSIRFPSDQLDIATMRRAHPDLFDVDWAKFSKVLDVITPDDKDSPSVGAMLRVERLLAQNAYEGVSGAFTPENPVTGEDALAFVEELIECYVRYGLASGPLHAQQLIRDFEAQAAGQAKSSGHDRV